MVKGTIAMLDSLRKSENNMTNGRQAAAPRPKGYMLPVDISSEDEAAKTAKHWNKPEEQNLDEVLKQLQVSLQVSDSSGIACDMPTPSSAIHPGINQILP